MKDDTFADASAAAQSEASKTLAVYLRGATDAHQWRLSMPTVYEPPEYNEAVMCPDCQEKSDVITGLYGLFGGGMGPYTMCADCGTIVTKSFESHEEPIDGEFKDVTKDKG